MSGPTPRNINQLTEATEANDIDLMILRQYDGIGEWQDKRVSIDTLRTAVSGGRTPWTNITGVSQAMVAWGKYIANNAAPVEFTLPTTAALGTELEVLGSGSGGWVILQGANQQINYGTESSTLGATGSLASDEVRSALRLVCVVADLIWDVVSSQGNINVN